MGQQHHSRMARAPSIACCAHACSFQPISHAHQRAAAAAIAWVLSTTARQDTREIRSLIVLRHRLVCIVECPSRLVWPRDVQACMDLCTTGMQRNQERTAGTNIVLVRTHYQERRRRYPHKKPKEQQKQQTQDKSENKIEDKDENGERERR